MFGTYSVAMVTPFTESGRIDWEQLGQLASHLIGQGVPALLISGTTGEQHSMTSEERAQLYTAAVQAAQGRVRIFAGVAATTTAVAVGLAEAAARAGADGIMLGLPPYLRPTDAELTEYVSDVSKAAGLPVLLYNNPPRTGTDIGVDAVVSLYEQGRIQALKHAGDLAKAREIIRRTSGGLKLYTGGDQAFLDAVANGFTGITSIIGNLLPRQMAEVVRLATSGDLEGARPLHQSISNVAAAVFATATPVGLKYAMRLRGLPAGYARKPLGTVTAEQAEAISRALSLFSA